LLPLEEKNRVKFYIPFLIFLILIYIFLRKKLISFFYKFADTLTPYPSQLETLKKEIVFLKAKLVSLKSLEAENKRLKELLGLKDENKKIIVSKVLRVNISGGHREILIDKGKEDGLEIGMYVFKKEYLIGQIIETFENMSRILLINDAHFYLPVYVKISESEREECLLKGNLKGELELEFVENFEKIKIGNKVYTQKFSSLLPDIYIGKVYFVNPEQKIIKVSSPADLKNFDFVVIYK